MFGCFILGSANHSEPASITGDLGAGSRAAYTHEAESTVSTGPPVTELEKGEMKITLNTQVSVGGSNFSNEQCQLIALAHALLCQSSIIILDKTTSGVDFATNTKIQATIRKDLNESLLLTVT